jgi:pantoate--beta-alanine ligase
MDQLSDIDEWRRYAHEQRARGRRVGLVPTMGALHEGHGSLVRAAHEHGDVVLATIFVNPRQFHNDRDLASYPRTPDADFAAAERFGVDCLIAPSLSAMWPNYPEPTATTVSVRGISDHLEGVGRPGHFDGVASVVAKLFAITGPCRAYFGEKDFQQLGVIRAMVRDLALDVEVVGCPIIRDPDGLALSSRNGQLTESGRARATGLSRALALVAAQPARASEHRARLLESLHSSSLEPIYAEVVDPLTLVPSSDTNSGVARALLACTVDGVRLIDNGPVQLVAQGE